MKKVTVIKSAANTKKAAKVVSVKVDRDSSLANARWSKSF